MQANALSIVDQFEKSGAFFNVIQEQIMTSSGTVISDKVVNIREDNGAILGVVGKGYKLAPYRESVVLPAVEALEASGLDLTDAKTTVKFAKNGGRMIGVITLPNEKMYVDTPRGKDAHELQVLLRSGHDADFFVDFRPGAVRIACFNGTYSVDAIGALKMKHTSKFNPQLLHNQAKILLTSFKTAGEKWGEWSRRDLQDDQAARVIGIYCREDKEVLNRGMKGVEEQKAKRETKFTRLVDRYVTHEKIEVGATAWGVYNTLTWDATHSPLSEGKEATSMVLRHANVNRVLADRYWTKQLQLAA